MIKLSKEQFNTIYWQAIREQPNECCGMLGGLFGANDVIEVTAVYPMTNADQSPDHFSLIPEEQFKVVKEIRKNGWKLVGNYHSHMKSPARPSPEDIRLAYDANILYFIISIEKQGIPVLKAYKIVNSVYSEVPLEII
ncbi:MAG: M67 family metallopeptidase [Bacillota bacterium]|nr:M67 family metallopeptidase [Bacillota bacterium]